jgi:hypothetical protein
MTRREGQGGFPPQTTLSRTPRDHSGPPRDRGFLLRRISPEDTGLRGESPLPLPAPPVEESTRARHRILRWLGRNGEGGGGGARHSWTPIFCVWSKPKTNISWRARDSTNERDSGWSRDGALPHPRPRNNQNPKNAPKEFRGIRSKSTDGENAEGGGGGRVRPGPLSSACNRSHRRKYRGGLETPPTQATQGGPGRTRPPPPLERQPHASSPRASSETR